MMLDRGDTVQRPLWTCDDEDAASIEGSSCADNNKTQNNSNNSIQSDQEQDALSCVNLTQDDDDSQENGQEEALEHGRSLPSLESVSSDSASDPFAHRANSTPLTPLAASASASVPAFVVDDDDLEDPPTPSARSQSQGPAAKRYRTDAQKRSDVADLITSRKKDVYRAKVRIQEQKHLAEEQRTKREEIAEEQRTKREEMRLAFEAARWKEELEIRREEAQIRREEMQKLEKEREEQREMLMKLFVQLSGTKANSSSDTTDTSAPVA